MFTKDEIQEIQRKLELSGKKLSQLPLVTEILEEDLLPILQKKENKSTTAGSYSLFVQNQILPKIEKLIEASTGEIKSSLLEVYKALLLNSEDNKNEIIEAINDLKAYVDLSKYLRCDNGYWSCYYPLAKNELPTSVYGDSQPLFIEVQYRKHTK